MDQLQLCSNGDFTILHLQNFNKLIETVKVELKDKDGIFDENTLHENTCVFFFVSQTFAFN